MSNEAYQNVSERKTVETKNRHPKKVDISFTAHATPKVDRILTSDLGCPTMGDGTHATVLRIYTEYLFLSLEAPPLVVMSIASTFEKNRPYFRSLQSACF